MPRRAGLWRRRDRGGDWYGRVAGRVERIAHASATKTAADAEHLRRLASVQGGPRGSVVELTTRDVVYLFLSHVEACVGRGELAASTHEGYDRHLTPLVDSLGSTRAVDLRPHHVTAWLDARATWGPTTRSNAIAAVKRAFRWSVRVGHLDRSPLEGLDRPTPRRREAIPSDDQYQAILAAVPANDPWRDVLVALRETGCRAKEVYGLTADRVDLARRAWLVANKTARKTGQRFRVVHLSDAALELTTRLLKDHPTGLLFRNTQGRAWTRNAAALRMRRLRRKLGLGKEAAVSGLRHRYVTDALEAGIPPATVAALVGHQDLTMIARVYSHLSEQAEHLGAAARRVRPGGTDAIDAGAEHSEG